MALMLPEGSLQRVLAKAEKDREPRAVPPVLGEYLDGHGRGCSDGLSVPFPRTQRWEGSGV